MEGYSNSYQNGTSARETEFQRLATNVGTNVQKILQNGENSILDCSIHIYIHKEGVNKKMSLLVVFYY